MTRFSFFAYKGDGCDCNECRAYRDGRLATLRLVYIGAACAGVLYEAAARYDYECWGPWTAVCATALATLNTLASLGDETAIGILAERP